VSGLATISSLGAWVVGLEGDISSFLFNKTRVATGTHFSFGGFTAGSIVLTTNVSSNWLATVRQGSVTQSTARFFYVNWGRGIWEGELFQYGILNFRLMAPASAMKQAQQAKRESAGPLAPGH